MVSRLPVTSRPFSGTLSVSRRVYSLCRLKVTAMARHLISSDLTLKAIRPGDPRKRISDGDGLYLLLFVGGGSHGWRFSYSYHGRRKLLSMGTYPKTGLALARKMAEEARQTLAEGIDPSHKRKDAKAELRAQW